ncbi:hypothetical protein [Streptomyces sp. NPDC060049]|uniref:hypothetical protein n=1 Tax=Streptomyces sp. NPDC060049 TaxID=3347046 RepID=UPI0036AF934A
MDRPRLRTGLYRTVLAEGQHEDLVALLNRELLLAQRPVLRTLVSRHLREVWKHAFPELAAAGSRRRVKLSDLRTAASSPPRSTWGNPYYS